MYWKLRPDRVCSDSRLCNDDPDVHAEGCGARILEDLEAGPAGDLLRRLNELQNVKEHGIALTLADITAEEVIALQILDAEREKQQQEPKGDH